MLSVLFLNPPFLPRFSRPQRSPAVTKSATLYYPLFLAQAAAVAAADGFAVDVCDAPADGLDLAAVTARAQARRPALAVLDTSTPSIDADIAAAPCAGPCPPFHRVVVGPTPCPAQPAGSFPPCPGGPAPWPGANTT